MASNMARLLRFLGDPDIQSYIQYPTGQNILDKERGINQYVSYMLDRTNSMFEYDNLPDTIPAYMLELYLQIFGYAAFVRVDSTNPINTPSTVTTEPGVYIMFGGIGGERDIYYRPKLFTGANPRIKNSIQSTILYPGDPTDTPNACVVMPSDHNYMGLLPLFNRYAQQLVENDISIRSAQINARAQVGISTSTDRDRASAQKYLDDLEAGKLGIIGETAFLDGISVANVSTQSANHIVQLIELQQYLKASWYNELGLNVNFNMKREYMSEEEIAVNTDILLPLVDDMLRCREESIALINDVFDLNISVHKSSAWANKEQEELAALSEASIAGEIPLKNTIQDKIEGGETNAPQEEASAEAASVQPQNDPEVSAVQPDSPVATEPGDAPAGEAPDGGDNAVRDSATVINVTVIQTQGGDVDADAVPEPETQEESKEPDAE